MADYVLSFKPAVGPYGTHDPSAVIFEDGVPVFGVEEERFSRTKHAAETFPTASIRACLDHCGIALPDVTEVVLPYDPRLKTRVVGTDLRQSLRRPNGVLDTLQSLERTVEMHLGARLQPVKEVRERLSEIGEPLPPIRTRAHHACHAASAFHLSPFDRALVLTADGHGEYDSTVVWRGEPSGIERIRTYSSRNSLGKYYAVVTEFLGYRAFNGEGKIMGLAPYGSADETIESRLRSVIDVGVDYDVTALTGGGIEAGVERLSALLGREPAGEWTEFEEWQADLAFVTQNLLEEIVTAIVERYLSSFDTDRVALAGGVALNCKMNKRIMEQESVEELFVQPVAHDGGLALGAGLLDRAPSAVDPMTTVYWGPEYDTDHVRELLETNKIGYRTPNDLEREIATQLADGRLVGWFQGRLEMGPRALGNRSILADPRTEASRDRVNKFVKHREEWRPFAPSMLEQAADDYLRNAEPAPYMIKTFGVKSDRRDEIEAVLHPGDDTTRPQTVTAERNPRYHRLISEFERLTGVPVVLNTSFNDHGEPIVESPRQALKDFFGMGLDTVVIGDFVVEKDGPDDTDTDGRQ